MRRMAVAGVRCGQVVTSNGAVSNAARLAAGNGSCDTAVAGAGNGQHVSDSAHDHNHIEEVIHNDQDHREFPAVSDQ